MSILSEQLVIGDKVVSNDITTDPVAESVTMRNGYYVDHKYPDNRPEMTGESFSVRTSSIEESFERFVEGEVVRTITFKSTGLEDISESKTAGQIG